METNSANYYKSYNCFIRGLNPPTNPKRELAELSKRDHTHFWIVYDKYMKVVCASRDHMVAIRNWAKAEDNYIQEVK